MCCVQFTWEIWTRGLEQVASWIQAGIFLKEMTNTSPSDLIVRLWEMSSSWTIHSSMSPLQMTSKRISPTWWSQNKRFVVWVWCCGECSLKLALLGVKVGLLCKEIFFGCRPHMLILVQEYYSVWKIMNLENINQCDVVYFLWFIGGKS